ncbi:TadE/TadG family type IV pilus assembly protein [Sulfitobacter sp. PS-8MA]|uniref:TadE/TadG family type IV pilus assembly protein n=1 Tax=Sulfitobacter sp. PS-8MA TaxID=3237707 RepID=UPI0034C6BDA3
MQRLLRAPTKPGTTKFQRPSQFLNDEGGSATIETVIWLPIFGFALALIMNVSMVFFTESQLTRIVQDGNRAFSLGRLADGAAVENYILGQLTHLDADLSVVTTVDNGFVRTDLEASAGGLMPLNLARSAFDSVKIRVSAQHVVEF